MKSQVKQIVVLLVVLLSVSCSSEEIPAQSNKLAMQQVTPPVINPSVPTTPIANTINYLALGDSYTIGQSVCETCRYPEQLKTKLIAMYPESSFSLKVIATTGWTTANLKSAINAQQLEFNYDLVTLLIGVNNQYQHQDFSVYEKEFPELVNKAIALAKGNNKNVIVLSIPDYAYTPFGNAYGETRSAEVSAEINQYNDFAQSMCITKGVIFISITDITRQGLSNTSLVASDGLHPSEGAYKLFVDRMLNQVKSILQK